MRRDGAHSNHPELLIPHLKDCSLVIPIHIQPQPQPFQHIVYNPISHESCPNGKLSNAEIAAFPAKVALVGVISYGERGVLGVVCLNEAA